MGQASGYGDESAQQWRHIWVHRDMTATTINEKVYQIRKGVLDYMNIQGGRQQHRLATLESDSVKLSNYEARLQVITAELEPSVATIKHSEEQQQILSSQIQQSVPAIQELLAACAGNHGGVRGDPDFQRKWAQLHSRHRQHKLAPDHAARHRHTPLSSL